MRYGQQVFSRVAVMQLGSYPQSSKAPYSSLHHDRGWHTGITARHGGKYNKVLALRGRRGITRACMTMKQDAEGGMSAYLGIPAEHDADDHEQRADGQHRLQHERDCGGCLLVYVRQLIQQLCVVSRRPSGYP